jgi:chromosome segregation ATPase
MDPEERESPHDIIDGLTARLAIADRVTEEWSARATEAEAKLAAALAEARNNHAAAASRMDQHAGLAKRMAEVQLDNKILSAAATESARDYNDLRENFATCMRNANAAQAIADQAASVVLDRDKEIAGLREGNSRLRADIADSIESNIETIDGLLADRVRIESERDHHMKRCDELVRLAQATNEATSGRIEDLKAEIDDALLVVQEQSHDIIGLVKAVSRAEREVQELRSRRAKGE